MGDRGDGSQVLIRLPLKEVDITFCSSVRFLLEDGKLNLCLRNLAEYKAYQHSQFLESREAKSTMVGLIFDDHCIAY